jgi:ribosome-associated translation inhibitor RaiA
VETTFDVITLTRGRVPADDREYAEEKLAQLTKLASRPIVKVRLKLTVQDAPHLANPAIVQVNIDLPDGHVVRARIEAGTIREAADLMLDRASRKLRRIADRYISDRRDSAEAWHHGDAPTSRPSYFPRPADERELIRRKAIGTKEATVDEAAFDMSMLDYDFYVFTDLETGAGALLFHRNGGAELVLRYAGGAPTEASAQARSVSHIDPQPAPAIDLDKAIDMLDSSGGDFVFFVDEETGEPSVAYHRYDGHYGLLTARSPG